MAILPYAERLANSATVIATYRHLRRSILLAFKDDKEAFPAAKKTALASFRQHMPLANGSVEAATALEHAQGVSKILRENVVQGLHKGDDVYKLRIHDQTQKMDNGTATTMKGTVKSFKEIKRAAF